MTTTPSQPRLGVCSWSLRPSSPADLAAKVAAAGLSALQLHLDPIRRGDWPLHECREELHRANVTILSGMMSTAGEDYSTLESIARTGGVRPDHTWTQNFKAAERNADLAAELGLKLVTLHAGFLPHGNAHDEQAERAKLLERLRQLADVFASRGVRVGLETGQERSDTLVSVLHDLNAGRALHDRVGVNFDPANMILYGMGDPIAAFRELRPHVLQVHIKDAIPAARPGEWGEEVRVGTGRVNWSAFFQLLREGPPCHALIEREAGESRVDDVIAARHVCERQLHA